MRKTTVKSFCSSFFSPKSIATFILPAAVVCAVGLIVDTAYPRSSGGISLPSSTVTESRPDGAGSSGEWETVVMRVTAYCACRKCCGRYSDGKTASGHKIRQGDVFVAADKKYSFGTEMIISGYNDGKPVEVLDRGGVIRGNRLDVFFNSHKTALKWGVKYLEVKLRRE